MRSLALLIAGTLLIGCNASQPSHAPSASPAPASVAAPASIAAPSPSAAGAIDGLFDVGGGRRLYLSCQGSGDPTVVYVHGLGGTRQNAGAIPSFLAPKVRICVYDRANRGLSDPLPGTHTAIDSAHDLHALLAAAGIKRPIILLGASFGGLISIEYAGTYPSDVAGLVLLDAILPNDGITDHFIPTEVGRHEADFGDDTNTEGVIASASLPEAAPLVSSIPDVPVTYLEATQLNLDPTWPVATMTAAIYAQREGFVSQFRQGRLVKVDSVHYMEPIIPQQIAEETLRVLDIVRGAIVSPSAG